MQELFKARPDIVQGLQNGTIHIHYSVAHAYGDGTSTITDLTIDTTRLDYTNLGR
jgi:hypothetical protein